MARIVCLLLIASAVAVFAQEDSDFPVRDLSSGAPLNYGVNVFGSLGQSDECPLSESNFGENLNLVCRESNDRDDDFFLSRNPVDIAENRMNYNGQFENINVYRYDEAVVEATTNDAPRV